MRSTWWLGVWFIVVLSACSSRTERTGLMVVASADSATQQQTAGLRVVASLGSERVFERTYTSLAADLQWPTTSALWAHQTGDSGPLHIEVTALTAAGRTFVTARAIASYVPGRVKRLDVRLAAQCADIDCPDDETCNGGTCVAAEIDTHVLPDYDPNADAALPGPPDGGPSDAAVGAGGPCRVIPGSACDLVCIERCNGVDDDCDGIPDNNGASSSCAIAHASAACFDGRCVFVACSPGFANCNADESDGCESDLGSAESCGACGVVCSFANASAPCVQGYCQRGVCDAGWGDCDGDPSNGCEASLSSLITCGACQTACAAGANAVPSCETGTCMIAACEGNTADCDGVLDNGCETSLLDPNHCGACARDCTALPNAAGTCGESGCEALVCQGAFRDCNGLADDGCEATLDQPANCGACGLSCDLPHVAAHLCEVSASVATCVIDATAQNAGCDPGYADCNGAPADGCEVALNTITHCGACGVACTFPNGTATCEAGTCVLAGCALGYDDCDGDGVCESLADDPESCGACDTACPPGAPVCAAGRCRVASCAPGFGDCDAEPADCETALSTATHCGACGTPCPATIVNGTASCASGACVITCDASFDDCDGDRSNGCETDLRLPTSCGGCGVACTSANAAASCGAGGCGLGTCNPGFGDCDGMAANGCEAALNTPSRCGACGNDCTGKPNTTGAGCSGAGACTLSCLTGYRNCDALAGNGCETSVTTPANCGACGNDCHALAHVDSATCSGASCTISACDPGWDDCNNLPSDGCERSITTLTDCGACGMGCSFPHAAASCSAMNGCSMGSCSTGFGNCDGMAANGCETQLNTTSHCGACGNACAGGETCNNGTCGAAECPTGYAKCDGSTCVRVDGTCTPWPCSVTRPGPGANCGGCGNTCPLFGCCLGI